MPSKANRPSRPGVPKPVDYNKVQGQGRLIVSKFYKSKEWKKARIMQLMEFPLCEQCHGKGLITPANTVDHIKQINPRDPFDTKDGRYGEPLDLDNLQSMCESCHNTKSAKERWGRK